MKLLASTASPYARKVRIVLAEKKIECELQPVDVSPVDNPVNAHNPLGKIPTLVLDDGTARDRKSTRLNSSHGYISYAVFCLKKKTHTNHQYHGVLNTTYQADLRRDAVQPDIES